MQKVLAAGGSLFPVGFYYKWFTRPPFVSRSFLRAIRPLTGIGRLPDPAAGARALPAATGAVAPGRDLGRWDTVVVGAGAAGLRAAAEAGGRVLVLDENDAPGGLRLAALRELAGAPAAILDRVPALQAALDSLEAAAAGLPANADLRCGWRVVAGYAPGGLLVRRGAELATLQADRVVWAAGAMDTLGLFAGNDTPGALGPRALYRLLLRDRLQVEGRHALLTGGGLDLWLAAALLAARGARISLVVAEGGPHAGIAAALDLKWQLTTGLVLQELARRGEDGLEAVFAPGGGAGGPGDTRLRLAADLAVVCGRGKPTCDIPYQLGADLALDPARGGFVAPAAAVLPGGAAFAAVGEAAGLLPDEVLVADREVAP
jgi:hypothetical protein